MKALAQRLRKVSEEIFRRTKRDPGNWIDHWHEPDDSADSCEVCKSLNLSQSDWDSAFREEN